MSVACTISGSRFTHNYSIQETGFFLHEFDYNFQDIANFHDLPVLCQNPVWDEIFVKKYSDRILFLENLFNHLAVLN